MKFYFQKNIINYRRQVSTEEGQDFAKKYNLLFFETSAKTYYNIDMVI